jgi:uncharacterized protein
MGCMGLRGLAGQMLYWAGCTRFVNLAHYKGNPAPTKQFNAGDRNSDGTLKIQLEAGGKNENLIRAYAPGSVTINTETYHTSLVVTPSSLVLEWGPGNVMDLAAEHIEAILQQEPELILIGSGDALQFPPAEKMRSIIEAGIGYEVMDTGAACRTYNILMAEGRGVVAGLIL